MQCLSTRLQQWPLALCFVHQITPKLVLLELIFALAINQFRGFNTNAATQYFIDGDAITGEPTLAQMGLGTRVNVQLDASANSSVTEGNATNVFIDTALAGPISAISPQIRVLGQVLTITADTVLVDIPGNNISELQVGQLL